MGSILPIVSPYSGSVYPSVQKLTTKECEVQISEMPFLKNPFNSIHAAALVNAGELTGGLVMVTYAGHCRHIRCIPVEINAKYMKKSKGTITVTCERPDFPETVGRHVVPAVSTLRNANGEVTAEVTVKWNVDVGEKKAKK